MFLVSDARDDEFTDLYREYAANLQDFRFQNRQRFQDFTKISSSLYGISASCGPLALTFDFLVKFYIVAHGNRATDPQAFTCDGQIFRLVTFFNGQLVLLASNIQIMACCFTQYHLTEFNLELHGHLELWSCRRGSLTLIVVTQPTAQLYLNVC